MSITDRIRMNGGEVIRSGHEISLRKGRLTDDAVKWIGQNKPALMREVWPEYDQWDERAAIMEFDGGMTRDEAQQAAYAEVMNA